VADEKLTAFRCKKCGTVAYPKRFLCLSCKGTDFEEFQLGDEAKVVTYTTLWAIPEGIEQLPLTLAIVEFGGGVRVTGQVLGGDVKVGDVVRPVWGHIRKIRGKDIQGFRFERA
jgi:uncharacterized OB-fold protein